MELYLLRHGIAVERGTPGYRTDFDRPLTVEGRKKMRQIARAIGELELGCDAVFSSPYVRARQTAEIIAAELEEAGKPELWDQLRADADPRQVLSRLKKVRKGCERVLLVGHEPNLSTLASLLISGAGRSCLVLKKGGLCKLAVQSVRVGRCAQLEWLLAPRQMLLMK